MRALVGYALAGAVIVGLAYVFEEPPQPLPPDPGLPPDVPRPPGWYELAGSTLPLAHGRRYRACVTVPAPASWAISSSMVQARAEREGFTDVRVTDTRPSDWGPCDGKWFVEATWGGADQLYARPGVVTRAWWLTT